jgi:hypothetical protein
MNECLLHWAHQLTHEFPNVQAIVKGAIVRIPLNAWMSDLHLCCPVYVAAFLWAISYPRSPTKYL